MADITIADVRAKYPQYSDLSDEQLAKGLHQKFYSDMPYDQFSSKIGLAPSKYVPDSELAVKPQPKEEKSLIGQIIGGYDGARETLLTLGTGATTGLIGRLGGTVGGIARAIASGKYGTQEGAQEAAQLADDWSRKLTYEPKTQEGKDLLESIGKAFDASKLAGLGPSEAVAISAVPAAQEASLAASQAKQAVSPSVSRVRQAVRDVSAKLPSNEAEMPGMGASNTSGEAMRRQRAADLPAPIELTKGQATRDFAQQQFEREAAKNPTVGEPLRQRFSDQNQKILQNFDAWIDQTGAEAGSVRAAGQVVTDAVAAKANKAKAEIRNAYAKAKEAGDMSERIDISPLSKYIEEHKPEAINAPVLSSVEAKLGVVSKDGTASINDLEELRKMAGRLGQKDATNASFAKEVKGLIDDLTDGQGGDLYRQARALRQRFGKEFEDHAVIDRLLSFKPGTKDRSVAYEDVFDHSILKGSLDDVRTVRRVLQTAGPQGQQAWRELQGQTIQRMKDEMTKAVQVDSAGNRVVSPASLDKIVRELDKDGKLDFVFGKQGAQQIRDVNGIAQDVLTAPPGAVNHSNTASIMSQALDKVASKFTGVPFAGSALNFASKEVRNAADRRKVKQALEKK